ncbi:hypothetical protein MPER_07813 [Moniliophthora perniciosa FA553]|nr:hypothetical protein MPER_07813 [Moniliophthora perniciosa FA553]
MLTAGRIWWVYRHRGQGQVGKSPLGTIVRILIESGAIYPIFTIVHVASVNSLVLKKLPFDLRATAVQTAGIAPTLIVVRVQSGKSVESTIHHCETQGEVLSEFRVTSCPAHSMGFSENTQLEMEKPSQVHALEMKPFSRSRGESSAGGSFKDNGLKDENAV